MKSPSVRPCSTTLRQKAAQFAASAQTVGTVKDCAVSSAESGPRTAAKAKADAPMVPRMIPPCPNSGTRSPGLHAPGMMTRL